MDDKLQEAINRARKRAQRGNRTERITVRVSPEEKRIIYDKFGGPSGLRDFGVGITSAAAVDLYIEDFRERLDVLKAMKAADEAD